MKTPNFPKVNQKQSFPALEEEIMKFWKENKIFEETISSREGCEEFAFYDGPPFATGTPHYGHILAGTIKDVIPRYQTMLAKKVDRKFGWDCHGLPIENIVEKKLNISGKEDIEKIGIYTFNETCRTNVFGYVDEWKKVVERMGRWVDIDNSYKTMDVSFMQSVWSVFKNIYDKGLIYEGHRVVPYCPRCTTPLSNFEVNQGYKDKQSKAVTVKFKVKGTESKYILAWTTTPWSIPGVIGLAVGEEISYSEILDIKKQETYIMATARINTYYKDDEEYEILREYNGKCLLGIEVEPIFDDFKIQLQDMKLDLGTGIYLGENAFKVVAGHHVTTDAGTGIVTTAPGYGEDDNIVGIKQKLGFVAHINDHGKTYNLIENNGVPVFEFNEQIVELLKSGGKTVRIETITHSYPHCWRCDTPLIYRAISAWYVAVEQIKDKMLKNNDKINWTPEIIKHGRFGKWLEGAKDWNISRNRYWGSAIPVWQSEDKKEEVCIGSIEELYNLNKDFGDITKVIFVRHRESEKNVLGIEDCIDVNKYSLTEKGFKDAEILTENLKYEKIDVIYCSPFKRCKQTIDLIANNYGVKTIIDDRLREINVGKFDGKNSNWIDFFDNTKIGETGESQIDCNNRIKDFLQEIVYENKGKTILVCSHGDPLLHAKKVIKDFDFDNYDIRNKFYPSKENYDIAYIYSKNLQEIDLHKHFVDEIFVKNPKTGNTLKRIPEVLDCWFESGAMPYASKGLVFESENKKEILEENKTYAINICLLPDEETKNKCVELNKLDNEIEYNNNSLKYVPHATIVMKYINKQDILFIKSELEKIDFSGLELETEDYYFIESGGSFWTGISLKESESLKKLKEKILNITEKVENKQRTKESYAVTNFFEENEIPVIEEKTISEKEGIHITFGKNDVKDNFEKINFPKKVKFSKICIGQMGNYGSVRKSLFEIENNSNLQNSFKFPADFIAEGLDQTRGWFYTLLILGTALFDNTPFLNVIVNGIVLAEDGKKMSKSLKNYPDPKHIFDKYGADAMRFYLMNSPVVEAQDLRFSEAGVEEVVKKVILPLWNTYSFFTTYANIDNFEPKKGNLYFIRHAKSESNAKWENIGGSVSGGNDNPKLTQDGVHQAIETGKKLKLAGITFDKIYTSDLERTICTAELIAKEIGFNGEIISLKELREQNYSDFEGKTHKELSDTYLVDVNDHVALRKIFKNSKVEHYTKFDDRINSELEKILKENPNKNILIVGHAGSSRPIFRKYLNLEMDYAHLEAPTLKNAQVVKLPAFPLTNNLDKWIISELYTLIKNVSIGLDSYKINEATKYIVSFMDNLTNWYIRRSRKRFWKSENDNDKIEAYNTLYEVLVELSKIISPFMPFVSESIYKSLTGNKSVHLDIFPENIPNFINESLNKDMDKTQKIINLGLAWRANHKIRVRQPLKSVTVGEKLSEYYEEIIKEELNVKEVISVDGDKIAKKICKPNGRNIGPKFGLDVKFIMNEAKSGNFEELTNGDVKVGEFVLENGDFELVYEAGDTKYDIEAGFGMVIAMDSEITQELKLEGYSRDIVRQIQEARKEANYNVDDRIKIALIGDEISENIIKVFGNYIETETLSKIENNLENPDLEKDFEFEDLKVNIKLKNFIKN